MTKDEMIESGYHDILLDIYRFIQQFGKAENTEEYWNTVAEASRTIARNYEGTAASGFVNSMLICAMNELQNIADRR